MNQEWMKKKNGIFGFITVRSVFYTCTARKEGLVEPVISTANPDLSQLPADYGGDYNSFNTSLSRKDTPQFESESFCEGPGE